MVGAAWNKVSFKGWPSFIKAAAVKIPKGGSSLTPRLPDVTNQMIATQVGPKLKKVIAHTNLKDKMKLVCVSGSCMHVAKVHLCATDLLEDWKKEHCVKAWLTAVKSGYVAPEGCQEVISLKDDEDLWGESKTNAKKGKGKKSLLAITSEDNREKLSVDMFGCEGKTTTWVILMYRYRTKLTMDWFCCLAKGEGDTYDLVAHMITKQYLGFLEENGKSTLAVLIKD